MKRTDSAKASREVKPIKTSGLSKDNNFLPNTFRQQRPERAQLSPANELAQILGAGDQIARTLQTSQRLNEEDERIRGAAASARGDGKETVVRSGLGAAIYGDAAADAWDDASSRKRAHDVHNEITNYYESNKDKMDLSELGENISKMYAEARAEGEAFGDRYVVGLGSVLQGSEDQMDKTIQALGRQRVKEAAEKTKYDELDAHLTSYLENPPAGVSTEELNKSLVNDIAEMSKSGKALGIPRDKYNAWVADAIYQRALTSGDTTLLDVLKTKDKSGMSIFDRMTPELKSRHKAKVHQIEVKAERMAEQKDLEDRKAKAELEDNIFNNSTGQILDGQMKIMNAVDENKTPEEIALLRKEQSDHLQKLKDKYLDPEGEGYSQLDGPARVRMFNMIKQAESGMYQTPDADTIAEFQNDMLLGEEITREEYETNLHKLGPSVAARVKSYMDNFHTAEGKNNTRIRRSHSEMTRNELSMLQEKWLNIKVQKDPTTGQVLNPKDAEKLNKRNNLFRRYMFDMNADLTAKYKQDQAEGKQTSLQDELDIRDKHLKKLKDNFKALQEAEFESIEKTKAEEDARKKEVAEIATEIKTFVEDNKKSPMDPKHDQDFINDNAIKMLSKLKDRKSRIEAIKGSGMKLDAEDVVDVFEANKADVSSFGLIGPGMVHSFFSDTNLTQQQVNFNAFQADKLKVVLNPSLNWERKYTKSALDSTTFGKRRDTMKLTGIKGINSVAELQWHMKFRPEKLERVNGEGTAIKFPESMRNEMRQAYENAPDKAAFEKHHKDRVNRINESGTKIGLFKKMDEVIFSKEISEAVLWEINLIKKEEMKSRSENRFMQLLHKEVQEGMEVPEVFKDDYKNFLKTIKKEK
jgi:hypothetical protein